MYMLSYHRWDRANSHEDFIRRDMFRHEPRKFMAVYAPPLAEAVREDEGVPIDPSEFGDIDKWIHTIDQKRIAEAKRQGPEDGWV